MSADSTGPSDPPEKKPAPAQFTLAFLLVVTVIVAVGAAVTRQMLIAWDVPGRRMVFALIVVSLPLLAVCVANLLIRLLAKWLR